MAEEAAQWRAIVKPVSDAHARGEAQLEEVFEAEERWARYPSARFAAVQQMLLTPAPDLAGVAEKMATARRHEALDRGEPDIAAALHQIETDIRRLAGVGSISELNREAAQ